MINMTMRLRLSCLFLAWLSILTTASALPPPSNLHDKLLRDEAKRKRAKATPTPTPFVPEVQPYNATTTTSRPATVSQSSAPQTRVTQTKPAKPSPQAARPSTLVVIDAGHGGFDRGGIPGQRVAEKTMNLDVAQRLRAILNANGYRTIMTRDSDVFVPLGTRVAIANSYRNAIFVCIHFNSATRRGANGIETYFYSGQSLGLASAIHYYVSRAAPSSNRGVRRRGFFVLRRTAIPSVLVECGFLTNPSEAQYAQSVNYRQMLAEQIARGVRSNTLAAASSGPRYASNETVPIQPYIDQTRVRDPDISGSRRKSKTSKSKKTSAVHKKKSTDEDSESKKTSAVHKKKSSDEESESKPKKKKSTAKKPED